MIALPVAAVVLFLSTGNLLITLFGALGIFGVVLTVLASIQLLGWSLGITEVIAAVMVIGLSVDYCLHVAIVWSFSPDEGYTEKQERFQHTSTTMGPTIFAAAITTAVSATVMFFCQLSFFSKMATLIAVTILGSVMFALFFLLPLALVTTPPGRPYFGSVYHCLYPKKAVASVEIA